MTTLTDPLDGSAPTWLTTDTPIYDALVDETHGGPPTMPLTLVQVRDDMAVSA